MKNAFTLIELLVTIALIAVLSALLMPAVGAARIANSRAISTHSLHGLAVAGLRYLAEHDNYFWRYSEAVDNGTMWWWGWESTDSQHKPEGQRTVDYSRGPLGPYAISSGNIATDPAFLAYSPRLKPKYINGNYGYGYNTNLDPNYPSQATTVKTMNAVQFQIPFSQLVLFATSAQVNDFQTSALRKNPMIEEFYIINSKEVSVHFRHGGKALAAFLDGSVREMEMVNGTRNMKIPNADIGKMDSKFLDPGTSL